MGEGKRTNVCSLLVRLAGHGKNRNRKCFKCHQDYLCVMVVLVKFHPFIPLSATSILFQGHSGVKQLKLKVVCLDIFLIGSSPNFVWVLYTWTVLTNTMIFVTSACICDTEQLFH